MKHLARNTHVPSNYLFFSPFSLEIPGAFHTKASVIAGQEVPRRHRKAKRAPTVEPKGTAHCRGDIKNVWAFLFFLRMVTFPPEN